MIEIILDGNNDNKFCNKEWPLEEISTEAADWNAYRKEAARVITAYADSHIVIIRIKNKNFSINKFALALFVESCQRPNKIEGGVIKVENRETALQAYRPYIALTIAIKYVMMLSSETPAVIYKNISELGYLGMQIQRDYIKNSISFKLPGNETVHRFKAENAFEALVITGIFKALALAKQPETFEAEIITDKTPVPLNEDKIIEEILAKISPWID